MSRLPRPPSSSPITTRTRPAGPSMSSSSMTAPIGNLKRKAIAEEDEATDQPSKLRVIGPTRHTSQPLSNSRNALNVSVSKPSPGPRPLTQPKPPSFSSSTSSRNRSTSAPPKSTTRSVSGPISTRPAAARAPAKRVVSGATGQVQDLENRMSSIEAARAADTAKLSAEMESERAKVAELQSNQEALSRELATARSQELNQRRELTYASDEIENLRQKHSREIMEFEIDLKKRDREIRELKEDLRISTEDRDRERETVSQLKSTISHQSTAHISLTTQTHALQAQTSALQSQIDAYASTVSDLQLKLETSQKRVSELEQDAMEAEGVRRKLHNMVQELKGNIRVFCRVRPVLPSDMPQVGPDADVEEPCAQAEIQFPDRRDHKEIILTSSSESATGQERKEIYSFAFDKVFEPQSTQAQVFEEISQLAQSCTDGYNVCIFAYGQTGSGKSFTMEGGPTDTTSGMIPRAVEQVFRVADELTSKGWEYKIEGQFLEIYNETINDLLGKGEFDKKKHEIKHDQKTCTTSVTDVNVIPLSTASQVRTLLSLAQSRRTVAATLMNERSSRSHSVFTLRITGTNKSSGEKCTGSLNLVDLAGSERLNSSGAGSDRERLKETQNINRSLSALGDVIAALGEKGEKSEKHIPYRNSKLTYLLQNSLSGNSKTLMVLNLSPLAAHLNESLTSLRFATKVNNTTIGTAKKSRA